MVKLNVTNSPKYADCKCFLVDVSLDSVKFNEIFEFDGAKLYLKKEFHITLVGNEDALLLRKKFIELFGESRLEEIYGELARDVEGLIENGVIEFLSEFYVLRKKYSEEDIRTSVVQIIETDLLDQFRELLKKRYNLLLSKDVPRPHITLYNELNNNGIGLYRKGDLDRWAVKKLERV
mgnify:CR=1 FL=1